MSTYATKSEPSFLKLCKVSHSRNAARCLTNAKRNPQRVTQHGDDECHIVPHPKSVASTVALIRFRRCVSQPSDAHDSRRRCCRDNVPDAGAGATPVHTTNTTVFTIQHVRSRRADAALILDLAPLGYGLKPLGQRADHREPQGEPRSYACTSVSVSMNLCWPLRFERKRRRCQRFSLD